MAVNVLIGALRKGMPKTVDLKLFFCLPTVHVHPVLVLRMFRLLTQTHV